PSEKHKLSFSVLGDPTTIDYSSNNGPGANRAEPIAANTQNQGGWNSIAEWDYFISPSVDTKLLMGAQRSQIDQGPQGKVRSVDPKYGAYDFDRPKHVNRRDDSVWGNCCDPITITDNPQTLNVSGRPKLQFDFSITWRPRWLGLHEVETGFQGLYSHF